MIVNNNQTEQDFLDAYDPSVFDRPSTAVDTAIFTVIDDRLQVLIVKRAEHPFKDQWSLVGGFVNVDIDDNIEATARRKLAEKTAVTTPYLEQYETVGNRNRDPRGWAITVVYFALIPSAEIVLTAGKGASDIKWSPVKNGKVMEKLAFDHARILQGCAERLRNKVLYTSLPAHLMPGDFTLSELQKIYEIILDKTIDHKSFRRRILNVNLVEETGAMRPTGKKPAKLYRLRDAKHPHFFLRNFEAS